VFQLFRQFVLDHCGELEDVAMRVVDDVKDELDVRD
jgi:predicted TIM-barrel fold metal-dependent hydrolase